MKNFEQANQDAIKEIKESEKIISEMINKYKNIYLYPSKCKNCSRSTKFAIEKGKTIEEFIKDNMDLKCNNCGCIFFKRSDMKFETGLINKLQSRL